MKKDTVTIGSVTQVMIMSQTLFVKEALVPDLVARREKEKESLGKGSAAKMPNSFAQSPSGKYFLAEYIRGSPIWKTTRFWEEAFYDGYAAEMLKYPETKRWHSQ